MRDRDTVRGYGNDTANQLGDGWRLDTDRPAEYGDVLLLHADGRTVRIEFVHHTGRLVARGLLPRDTSGPCPSITVRLDRGPAVLAREITRRLLPTYDPLYAHARQYLLDQADARAAREALVTQAIDIPGTRRQPDARANSSTAAVDWYTQAGRGSIRFDGDGSSADLTLRGIPGRLAIDLLARLAAVTST